MNRKTNESCRLLMIDDDTSLCALLAEYMARFGFELESEGTAAGCRKRLLGEPFDLIILDIMLPDTDGLTLCREIRAERDVPVIMLTARGELADRVVGLELGADDYVAKPFEPRELVARVESVLRRYRERVPTEVLASGGLRMETDTRRVSVDGKDVELTTMEFELLRVLLESRGRVLSRDQILERLRGLDATDVYDRSIDMLVSRLRQKLADDSRSPRFIKTIWRTGYQFIGDVRK